MGWQRWGPVVIALALGACQGDGRFGAEIVAAVVSDTPFVEGGGQVVIEAENATGEGDGTGIAAGATWTGKAIISASGGVAIEATPNAGVHTGETTVGPRRDYKVRFTTPGTYQVWIRAWGPTSSDDSLHAGLNGTPVSLGASGVNVLSSNWGWVNTVGSRRLTVTVTSAGLATVNLWMREDGVRIDKLLLTTSSSFTPSGPGPAESPRDSQPQADAGQPDGHVHPEPDSAPPPVDMYMAPPAEGAFAESGGEVVMEAENATGEAAGTGSAAGSSWTVRAVSAASGGSAIEATPNAGVHTADTTVGPRRDYRVRFATAGTYQLWVRARGPTTSDDTVHAGLNGTPATLGGAGLLFPPGWTWMNKVDTRRVTVTVSSPGLATINLWMREDGLFVDKILLTTNASFTPSGTGPAESSRDGQPPPPPPPDGGAPPPSGGEVAFVENGGQVAMEAENATGAAAGTGVAAGSTWTARAAGPASAGMAIEATPNAGVRTGDMTVGPRRDYRVRFSTAGTYQVWVRASGPTTNDDTFHAGLNGTPATLGESGLLVPPSWTWINKVGPRRVTVTVPGPGLATVNLWMREDGIIVDKILLTTNASFTPSGTGPAESPREGTSPPPPPAGQGQWSPVVTWPAEAVHAHVLPDGRVLMFPYGDHDAADPHLWDPATNVFTPVPNARTNVGCSGHAFLPDGRLLVAGGEPHSDHTGNGIVDVNLFDYRTSAWSAAPDMNAPRWYPNVTTLANGEMAVITGDTTPDTGNPIPQVFTAAGTWRTLDSAHRVLPSYAFTFLAPDGRVFVSGPERHSVYLDTSGTGTWSDIVASTNFPRIRTYGSSVMYDDGKVIIMGGGDPPTSTVEVIDLGAATPRWRNVAPMNFARRQATASLLPDGRVLVVGGSSGPGHNNVAGAVLQAEFWDPATETWTVVAAKNVPSLYHSAVFLLPDGRVVATPGRVGGPSPYEESRETQFYSPDYLLRGARPVISAAPASVGYGQTFFVATSEATSIGRVTWIRLPSVTHAIDMNQRINRLSFVVAPGGLDVTAPSNRNLCPPGHYMLFILDRDGVPSVARIVQIT